ncbi:MAG: DUF1738 domain-containing protein [Candidatus Omnitrophica bacterium]|nr:DUF1738 domain-containing protein [Candidatus Omnitrophota bacterium]
MKQSVYEIITAKIITSLEKGLIPWRMPWTCPGSGIPVNYITKRKYSGINKLLLYIEMFDKGYERNEWLTFKQCKSLDVSIKKGERCSLVCYYSYKSITKENQNGEAETKAVPFFRYYRIFNVGQTTLELSSAEETSVFHTKARAEEIIRNMPMRPEVKRGRSASYVCTEDVVRMPRKELFISEEEYYSTFFHELAHATGHTTRLNRFSNNSTTLFGGEQYSFEELIAELGSCFLCAESGFAQKTLENSSAYIKGWLKTFKSDNRFIIRAANKAQKAVDYILAKEKDGNE